MIEAASWNCGSQAKPPPISKIRILVVQPSCRRENRFSRNAARFVASHPIWSATPIRGSLEASAASRSCTGSPGLAPNSESNVYLAPPSTGDLIRIDNSHFECHIRILSSFPFESKVVKLTPTLSVYLI